MCLVGIAWHAHPHWPLVLLANRDELHRRPSAAAAWWAEAPDVVGGRDAVTGGSWQAMHRNGRFAVVINLASADPRPGQHQPRGALVREWVTGNAEAEPYLERTWATGAAYRGFLLLLSDGAHCYGMSSAANGIPRRWTLSPGIAAFSNDGDAGPRWPKVAFLEQRLGRLLAQRELDQAALFDLLAVRQVPPPPEPEPTGFKVSSQPFVVGRDYGTRSSTVVIVAPSGAAEFAERRFDPTGALTGDWQTRFAIANPRYSSSTTDLISRQGPAAPA